MTKGDELVQFLVEKGAKLDAKDKYNRTPLDVAMGVPGGRPRPRRRARRSPRRSTKKTAALLKELASKQ